MPRFVSNATAVGGATLIMGGMLPWMSMFAGLKQFPGILGVNGWLLVTAGVLLMLVPLAAQRGRQWAPTATILSVAALTVVAYAGTGLLDITRDAGNALMVPRVGPGLPLALVGGTLSLTMALLAWRAPTRH